MKHKEIKEQPDLLKAHRKNKKSEVPMKVAFKKPLESKDIKASRERIEDLLRPKPTLLKVFPTWTVKESEFEAKEWIVVLTKEGELYQEPLPRCVPTQIYIEILATYPEEESGFKILSVPVQYLEVGTKTNSGVWAYIDYMGTKESNNFARVFAPIKEKLYGGNLIFSKAPDKGFTKKEAEKFTEWVIKQLEKDEEIEIKD